MASLLPLVPIRLVPIPARAKPRAASSQPSLRAFGGRNTQTGPTAALGLGPTPKFDCDSPELLPSLSLSLSLFFSPFLYPHPANFPFDTPSPSVNNFADHHVYCRARLLLRGPHPRR